MKKSLWSSIDENSSLTITIYFLVKGNLMYNEKMFKDNEIKNKREEVIK